MVYYLLKNPVAWRVAAIVVTVVIAWLTLSPWATDARPLKFGQADKIWHILAFATWGALMALSWSRPFWQMLLAAGMFGGGIELIQPFVGRDAEMADLGVDMLGAGLGLWAGKNVPSWVGREGRGEA
ncbi:VanZ family protein [Roseovarius indicus]|uniref:VanZ family protein n=1 Tax=Roseovarius indicus TaxID=540747 RepID=UPI0040595FC5